MLQQISRPNSVYLMRTLIFLHHVCIRHNLVSGHVDVYFTKPVKYLPIQDQLRAELCYLARPDNLDDEAVLARYQEFAAAPFLDKVCRDVTSMLEIENQSIICKRRSRISGIPLLGSRFLSSSMLVELSPGLL